MTNDSSATGASANLTEVNFQHSGNLAPLLQQLGVSFLVSTYQAGKVLSVGTHADKIHIHFHHFEQAMGLARTSNGLAVGTRRQIWFLPAALDLAARLQPAGQYDGCFVARRAHFTGPIMGHDLAWCELSTELLTRP